MFSIPPLRGETSQRSHCSRLNIISSRADPRNSLRLWLCTRCRTAGIGDNSRSACLSTAPIHFRPLPASGRRTHLDLSPWLATGDSRHSSPLRFLRRAAIILYPGSPPMRALAQCFRHGAPSQSHLRQNVWWTAARRASSVVPPQSYPSEAAPNKPWFVDTEEWKQARHQRPHASQPSRFDPDVLPVPGSVPPELRTLHEQLCQSPHLELSQLEVCEAVYTPPGPPLPDALPRGKRKRGGTVAGEGIVEPGRIWRWTVLAEVGFYLART